MPSENPVVQQLIAVLTSVCVAVVLLAGCGHHASGTQRAAPTTSATSLAAGGSNLIALLAKGRKGTWHARYALTAGGALSGATTLLEVWFREPQQRQDVEQRIGSTVVSHSETFELVKSTVTCSQQAGAGPWLCTPTTPAKAGDLLKSASAQLDGVPVSESTDVLQGRPVRCFQATVSGQATRICLTAEGIPALYVTGQAQMQLTSLDTSVPTSVFTPPASVTGSSPR